METPFSVYYWHWWALAIGLLILEILLPGAFFLWPALAALCMGFIIFFLPQLVLEYQILIFSVVAVISVIISRYYMVKHPPQTDHPFLNLRGSEYVGCVCTLTEPIINGEGRLKIDGSSWRIEGPNCPAGTQVKIIAVHSVHFQVELYNNQINL